MKILAPVSNFKEIIPLIKEGADEFYFGINLSPEINDITALNARPFKGMNLQTISGAQKVIQVVKDYKKKIYICFNNKIYSDQQYSLIIEILSNLKGLNGVIVVDIPLIQILKRNFSKLEIIVSTISHVFNSEAIDFYRQLGVERFTLSRNLYFPDILNLINKYKDYKFEIFIKNEDCFNINGLCNYTHNIWDTKKLSFCRLKERKCKFVSYNKKDQRPGNNLKLYWRRFPNRNCGVCFLYQLNKVIAPQRISLKFAGREYSLEQKLKDTRFIRKSLSLLNSITVSYTHLTLPTICSV